MEIAKKVVYKNKSTRTFKNVTKVVLIITFQHVYKGVQNCF